MGKAILQIDFPIIEDMLHLPKGYCIVAVLGDITRKQLQILIESEAIQEQQEGQEYPHANLLVTVEHDREQPNYSRYTTEVKIRDW